MIFILQVFSGSGVSGKKSYMEKCENDTLIDCRRNVDLSQGNIMCEFGERGYVDYFAEEFWAIG